MKFAQYLKKLDETCPPEWQGKFLAYKSLKKTLEKCPDPQQKEDLFFHALEAHVKAINRNFEQAADRILRLYHRKELPYAKLMRLLHCGVLGEDDRELARQAAWCRRYAKVNAVGLRKILKKYDKKCKDTKGRVVLQECWNGKSADGRFLHSPLLDELQALQLALGTRRPAVQEDPDHAPELPAGTTPLPPGGLAPAGQPAGGAPAAVPAGRVAEGMEVDSAEVDVSVAGSCGNPPAAECHACAAEAQGMEVTPGPLDAQRLSQDSAVSSSHGSGEAEEDDASSNCSEEVAYCCELEREDSIPTDQHFRCPICLDVMYRPLGLVCGHKFCKPCLLEAARVAHLYGSLFNVLQYAHVHAACPQCRQEGVIRTAVKLPALDSLIRKRYPEDWRERDAEEKKRIQMIRARYLVVMA